MTPADLRQSLPRFENFVQRFAPLLGDDSRPARAAYLRGLLLDADSTKTAEAIALKVHGTPTAVRMTQVFLSQSPWRDRPLKIANGQVAVYLSYAGPGGHTLLDTRLVPRRGRGRRPPASPGSRRPCRRRLSDQTGIGFGTAASGWAAGPPRLGDV